MLTIAQATVFKAGLEKVGLDKVGLRHGDIFDTGLPVACADLVLVPKVLHYLADPAAVAEAARLVLPGGGC